MVLKLTVDNVASLPDGGPLSYEITGQRGIDIGRDPYLDWTLPDPSRAISSKHCEVRFHNGDYWLYDVSTNGTFVNGSDGRLQSPHRLRNGDRIDIGHYIITVTLAGDEARPTPEARPSTSDDSIWNPVGEAAEPMPPGQFVPPRPSPIASDPLGWIDPPEVASRPRPETPPPQELEDWTGEFLPLPQPPTFPRIPEPRHPGISPQAEPEMDESPWRPPAQPWSHKSPPPPPPTLPEESPRAASAPLPEGWEDFTRRLARAAGIPEETLAGQDRGALADQLGLLLRLTAENLKQLLAARADAKRMVRSPHQTTIQAMDNNPLKFAPTAQDALRIMLGPPNSGYLNAQRALEQGFQDLKVHQVKSYSAMQHALRLLTEDLSPHAIEATAGSNPGFVALLASRKARLWDTYVARWDAKTAHHDDGLVNAFMRYFAECYDGGRGESGQG